MKWSYTIWHLMLWNVQRFSHILIRKRKSCWNDIFMNLTSVIKAAKVQAWNIRIVGIFRIHVQTERSSYLCEHLHRFHVRVVFSTQYVQGRVIQEMYIKESQQQFSFTLRSFDFWLKPITWRSNDLKRYESVDMRNMVTEYKCSCSFLLEKSRHGCEWSTKLASKFLESCLHY